MTAAFSDYSQRFTAAIKAVFPAARFPADHCHTVKKVWGHRKKSRLSSRRTVTAQGENQNEAQVMARAKRLWTLRWSLLKKPANLSGEETPAIAALESEEAGVVHRCRSLIRPLVTLFDHAPSEAQATLRLKHLRKDIHAVEDPHLAKRRQFLDEHWEHAFRSLRKKGMGKHRRGSNSESGMRLLRRLEKNHDGMRSAATRQPYMPIYQAIKSLSLDVADFLEQGPQITELSGV